MSRRDLGLSDDALVYLCPQSEFKLHPDFDAALAGILRADPRATVAISEGAYSHWTEMLKVRLRRTLSADFPRVVFVPRVPAERFRGLLASADVVLDPRYFTGGHTTYLAFSVGVPVVTWNGDHLRGRMTAGLYAMMGVEGPIADDTADYVRLAVELANDPGRRQALSETIRARSGRIFNDVEGVREFERFLLSVCRPEGVGHRKPPPGRTR